MVDYTSNILDIFVIGDIDSDKKDALRKTLTRMSKIGS